VLDRSLVGLRNLIDRSLADNEAQSVALTTEEEGVALLAGADLGGARGVLLMQSSGVGNCINMLSMITVCRFPLLMLVTMRGEWAEFNPWQIPMGKATRQALEIMGVTVFRLEQPEDAEEVVSAASALATSPAAWPPMPSATRARAPRSAVPSFSGAVA